MQIVYRKKILKADKTSTFKLFSSINSIDNTKFPCYTPPLTQHDSTSRNLPPRIFWASFLQSIQFQLTRQDHCFTE